MSKSIVIKRLVAIAFGAALMGFGVNYFNIANNLAEGGVTGLAVLLKLAFDIDPGLSSLIINIPLFILGYWQLGKRAMIYTLYGTICLSVSLSVFGSFRLPLDDMMLASLYAGVSVGLGLGLIFRFGGTTGGSDIISRIISRRYGWSVGRTMFAADVVVICISLVYLPLPQAMYTLVAIFIGSRVLDLIQDAAYSAKALMVISETQNEIAQKIMNALGRGTTILNGQGGWTGQPREVLYIVCARSQVVRTKDMIREVDPYAFVTVTDVHEVIGEGFTYPHKQESED